jgi:hypothetical protein
LGIAEESVDAFDELVEAVMSPGVGDEGRRRGLFTQVPDDLVGPDDAAGHALIQATPMRSGFASEVAARAWIVDLLASAARRQESQWWAGWDDDGYPRIHGGPFRRLRDRTGLVRAVLARRIQLMLSQLTVADGCGVVQGEVQSWEAGVRIPSQVELDRLADVLSLDRDALAGGRDRLGGVPQRVEPRPAGRT